MAKAVAANPKKLAPPVSEAHRYSQTDLERESVASNGTLWRFEMYVVLPSIAVILFVTVPAIHSATPSTVDPEQKPCEIWGQVAGSSRLLQEGLGIELVGLDGAVKQRTRILTNGNFEFTAAPAGYYKFRVTDVFGKVIYQQTKSLGGEDNFVFLVVPDPRARQAAKDTVSLSALQHKTPRRAWDAFRAAQKANASGETELSIQRLHEALVADPDFPEAHSDLAAIYAKMDRLDEALEHAETAFKLNPQLPEAGCNFALLLVSLKRYPEAESTARHMLSGGYYVSVLHSVLAISLIEQRKDINDGLEHLKQAVTELPFVRLLAAHALADIGRRDLAAIQVKQYLQVSAHDCERPALEAWLTSVQPRLTSDK
jgi:Tfp pilus assembly protein PilF